MSTKSDIVNTFYSDLVTDYTPSRQVNQIQYTRLDLIEIPSAPVQQEHIRGTQFKSSGLELAITQIVLSHREGEESKYPQVNR